MSSANPTNSEQIATDALIWIAGDADRAGPFLAASGLDPAELRSRAADPEFLSFLLSFLCEGDEALLAFCADSGHRPEDVIRARDLLGGPLPNWT